MTKKKMRMRLRKGVKIPKTQASSDNARSDKNLQCIEPARLRYTHLEKIVGCINFQIGFHACLDC